MAHVPKFLVVELVSMKELVRWGRPFETILSRIEIHSPITISIYLHMSTIREIVLFSEYEPSQSGPSSTHETMHVNARRPTQYLVDCGLGIAPKFIRHGVVETVE